MSTDELLRQLLDDDPHYLSPTFRQWFLTSRRFRAFAERYQPKIRAKLRGTRDAETLADLLFELEIACWLLQEKRFQIAYEEQGLRTAPGPDFTVSFTTKVQFHMEVTRIRASGIEEMTPEESTLPTGEALQRKVLYVILAKLNQLRTGAQNVILIGVAPELSDMLRVDEILKQLKLRIEMGDPALLARSRFQSPGAFFKQYYALSAILLYHINQPPTLAAGAPGAMLWLNQDAKQPLLTQVQTILRQQSALHR